MTDFLTRKALSKALGISERRISQYVEEGRLSRTAEGLYSLAEARELRATGVDHERNRGGGARTGRPVTANPATGVATKAKLHELAYRAKSRELAYKNEASDLVEAAAVTETCEAMAGVITAKLDSWNPAFLEHLNERGLAVFRALIDELRDETVEALRKVA
ncbi:hypothetical protein E8L99_17630 [Phreatobacter aquaticus]|uniref:Uncharacterized protein n=1 Tax=Phreatobacter aquaticus TaxID=2570229 RepID=A0A4D7QIY7_9HYPH|nr:hypothetical protein [Phreatobacter aquaticus]QCK87448.1 hypothetical protein E8L99_17630 [Phreatobacter aquaticus]